MNGWTAITTDRWIIVGISLLLIFWIILVIMLEKNKEQPDYDERQIALRGKAYQLAFFTLLVYHALYGMVCYLTGRSFCQDGLASFLGIFLATGVFSCYCILNDAFSRGNAKNNRAYFLMLAVIVLTDGFTGIVNVLQGQIIENGHLSYSILPLAIACTFLADLVAIGLRRLQQRKEETE